MEHSPKSPVDIEVERPSSGTHQVGWGEDSIIAFSEGRLGGSSGGMVLPNSTASHPNESDADRRNAQFFSDTRNTGGPLEDSNEEAQRHRSGTNSNVKRSHHHSHRGTGDRLHKSHSEDFGHEVSDDEIAGITGYSSPPQSKSGGGGATCAGTASSASRTKEGGFVPVKHTNLHYQSPQVGDVINDDVEDADGDNFLVSTTPGANVTGHDEEGSTFERSDPTAMRTYLNASVTPTGFFTPAAPSLAVDSAAASQQPLSSNNNETPRSAAATNAALQGSPQPVLRPKDILSGILASLPSGGGASAADGDDPSPASASRLLGDNSTTIPASGSSPRMAASFSVGGGESARGGNSFVATGFCRTDDEKITNGGALQSHRSRLASARSKLDTGRANSTAANSTAATAAVSPKATAKVTSSKTITKVKNLEKSPTATRAPTHAGASGKWWERLAPVGLENSSSDLHVTKINEKSATAGRSPSAVRKGARSVSPLARTTSATRRPAPTNANASQPSYMRAKSSDMKNMSPSQGHRPRSPSPKKAADGKSNAAAAASNNRSNTPNSGPGGKVAGGPTSTSFRQQRPRADHDSHNNTLSSSGGGGGAKINSLAYPIRRPSPKSFDDWWSTVQTEGRHSGGSGIEPPPPKHLMLKEHTERLRQEHSRSQGSRANSATRDRSPMDVRRGNVSPQPRGPGGAAVTGVSTSTPAATTNPNNPVFSRLYSQARTSPQRRPADNTDAAKSTSPAKLAASIAAKRKAKPAGGYNQHLIAAQPQQPRKPSIVTESASPSTRASGLSEASKAPAQQKVALRQATSHQATFDASKYDKYGHRIKSQQRHDERQRELVAEQGNIEYIFGERVITPGRSSTTSPARGRSASIQKDKEGEALSHRSTSPQPPAPSSNLPRTNISPYRGATDSASALANRTASNRLHHAKVAAVHSTATMGNNRRPNTYSPSLQPSNSPASGGTKRSSVVSLSNSNVSHGSSQAFVGSSSQGYVFRDSSSRSPSPSTTGAALLIAHGGGGNNTMVISNHPQRRIEVKVPWSKQLAVQHAQAVGRMQRGQHGSPDMAAGQAHGAGPTPTNRSHTGSPFYGNADATVGVANGSFTNANNASASPNGNRMQDRNNSPSSSAAAGGGTPASAFPSPNSPAGGGAQTSPQQDLVHSTLHSANGSTTDPIFLRPTEKFEDPNATVSSIAGASGRFGNTHNSSVVFLVNENEFHASSSQKGPSPGSSITNVPHNQPQHNVPPPPTSASHLPPLGPAAMTASAPHSQPSTTANSPSSMNQGADAHRGQSTPPSSVEPVRQNSGSRDPSPSLARRASVSSMSLGNTVSSLQRSQQVHPDKRQRDKERQERLLAEAMALAQRHGIPTAGQSSSLGGASEHHQLLFTGANNGQFNPLSRRQSFSRQAGNTLTSASASITDAHFVRQTMGVDEGGERPQPASPPKMYHTDASGVEGRLSDTTSAMALNEHLLRAGADKHTYQGSGNKHSGGGSSYSGGSELLSHPNVSLVSPSAVNRATEAPRQIQSVRSSLNMSEKGAAIGDGGSSGGRASVGSGSNNNHLQAYIPPKKERLSGREMVERILAKNRH